LAIHDAHNSRGIREAKLLGQQFLGRILESDSSSEPVDGAASDGSAAAIGGGGVRTAMHHSVADLDTGRISLEHDAADSSVENLQEPSGGGLIFSGQVDGRREIGFGVAGDGQSFIQVAVADENGGGAKDLGG